MVLKPYPHQPMNCIQLQRLLKAFLFLKQTAQHIGVATDPPPPPPPFEMSPVTKMRQKPSCFFSFSFSKHFLLTTVTNKNNDDQVPSIQFLPTNLNVYIPRRMESFVLKVPILGPHLPFYERNAITRAGFTIIWLSTIRGSRAQMVRLFFVFTYLWHSKCLGPRTI